tara:strand:- start:462 stop:1094 length:633 start_codon:yes stop_codon:yes gene_type:complete
MIVYDDLSTDQTAQVVEDISKTLNLGTQLSVISRTEKFGEVRNTIDAMCGIDDNEIVCRLDGGDWLTENDALFVIDQTYKHEDPAVLWTMHRWAYTTHNISGPLNTIDANVYEHPWVSSHLKTFRRDAMNGINHKNYHDDDGNWIMIGCDQAIFLPMMHKALMDGRKRIFLPMVCYHYNINLSDPTLFTCDRSKKQKYDVEKLRERGYIE